MATKAKQQSGFGDTLEVARVFPANGKGERLVALIPKDVSQRRDSSFFYAMLTPEGTQHPLAAPDMAVWAQGFDCFTPGTFRWLDDDTFCLLLEGGASSRIEVWRLSTPPPSAEPSELLPAERGGGVPSARQGRAEGDKRRLRRPEKHPCGVTNTRFACQINAPCGRVYSA